MKTKVRILLADDHQMIIDGIKSLLAGSTRFLVTGEATNGQHAMDLLSSSPGDFDILLTDVSMPLLSGTDLCRMVKDQLPGIKVAMLSMYTSNAAISESVLAEADGYILKTAGREELLSALERIADGGTWFARDIFPVMFREYNKAKIREEKRSILTPREFEIVQLIVAEFTSGEIAEKLNISRKTVDNHRQSILSKTASKSTIGLVKFALQNGLATFHRD